jgi:ABC-type sugar transport system ATPase subunit
MSWLSFNQISKRFPGVLALNEVSLVIERGECHAIVGENGAGKSTLGKILAGVYTADSGVIRIDNKTVSPNDPLAARCLGIAMVHQELAFCPNLSVAENLCLGSLPGKAGFVNRRQMREQAQTMLNEIEADIRLDSLIGDLSPGQEQMVQIAAALGVSAQIIIMDEPTSSLSAKESEHLFALMAELKRRQITVLYVSHRMEEIFKLSDRISVLRDGKHVATRTTKETSPGQIVQLMIGRDLAQNSPAHVGRHLGSELLRVDSWSSAGKFRDIHFELHEGEILGLAGLVGAGRSEVAQAIFGLDPHVQGRLRIRGREYRIRSPQQALALGIGLLPEDRKKQGLVLSMNCRENSSLAALGKLTRAGFIRRTEEKAIAERYARQLRVKAPSLEAPISGLSGGNQQKIALAKWLARHCKILIVDEPTRGVDVGAKSEIHQLLDELASQGVAILLLSSELPEIMSLSRRIIVLREGVQMGELDRAQFSEESLMRLMAGVQA